MILKNKTEIRYFAGIFSSNQFVEIVICISGAYAEPCQTSVIGPSTVNYISRCLFRQKVPSSRFDSFLNTSL